MECFGNRIQVWTENDLSLDFKRCFASRLILGSRGFGYWCWKPQVVLQMFDLMGEGDVLLYVDAGCHLNLRGRRRLEEYADLARENGIVPFQARSMVDSEKDNPVHHFLTDAHWSKGDLLTGLGVRDNPNIVNTGQLAGGIFLARKDSRTIDFFHRFLAVFEEHFDWVDDSPSRTPNLPGFVENRHDQSVFGLLAKEAGYPTLSCGEYGPIRSFAPPEYAYDPAWGPAKWEDLRNYPIWAKHDKGGWKSHIPSWIKKPLLAVMGARSAKRTHS